MGPPAAWCPPPSSAAPLRERARVEEWHAAIVALAARHEFDARAAEPFATGSDVVFGDAKRVYELSEPACRAQAERERRWLAHFEGKLSVATPRVLAAGELEGWPYTVMSRVRGVALARAWPRLDAGARVRLAARIGALAAELHALAPPADGDFGAFAREAVAASRERRAREVATRPELARLADEAEAFLERTFGDVATAAADGFGDARRVGAHTELYGEHLLVTDDAEPLPCGLIDVADARVAPPDYDVPALVEFVFGRERDATRAFLDAWEPRATAGREERILAWMLCHRYASLARLARAAGDARDFAGLRENLLG